MFSHVGMIPLAYPAINHTFHSKIPSGHFTDFFYETMANLALVGGFNHLENISQLGYYYS